MKKKQWKAAIYLRLSKEDGSVDESSSIKNQREIIKDFISKNSDIKIVSERIDDGVSGVSFDRPSFNAMIEDVRDRVIDCIIVKDLSRFGRDHIEAGDYIRNIFPFFGARFISINDHLDTIKAKSEVDNILVPIKNIINSNYSRDISIKSKSSLEIKRKKGEFVGAFAIYGYKKSKENKNQLVIDEKVADNVRDIFKLKLSGMSAEKIAEYLNNMGVWTPAEYKKMCATNYVLNFVTTDKPKWHAKTVLRILENAVYIGVLEQGKISKVNYKVAKPVKKEKKDWIIVEDTHEAIIEKAMFENVQRSLMLDTRTSPNEKNVYIFSGLMYCADCGEVIKRKTIKSNGKKYIYYSCVHCKSRNIKEETLIQCVNETVKHFIKAWVNAEDVISEMEETDFFGIKVKKLNEHKQNLMQELENTQKFKLALYEKFVDGKVSENDYNNFYNIYNRQETETTGKVSKITKEIEYIKENDDKATVEIKSFKKFQNIECLNRANAIELIEQIEISDKKQISITFRYKDELNTLLMLAKSESVVC